MADRLFPDRDSLIKRDGFIQRAAYLRITTRSLATALQSGAFRSLYHGQGVEFSGVREYLRGDDVRAIDWNVTARTAKPFVKIFEEERELQIFLIVDRSLSMYSGTKGRSRLETASETAALLTLAAEHNGNAVGAVLFGNRIEFSCKPKSGQTQTMFLLSKFDEYPEQVSKGSVLENAITGAGRLLRKRSLVFVISDFRVKGWEDSFAYLAERHDVVAVRITDPSDSVLPEMGSVVFEDPEKQVKRIFPTSSRLFRSQWKEEGLMRAKRWQDACIRHGGVPLVISTSDDPLIELSSFFAKREI